MSRRCAHTRKRRFKFSRAPLETHTNSTYCKKGNTLRIHVLKDGCARLVLAISYLQKTVYLCEICGFGYADEATANSCENFCREHKSCSLQIAKKAVVRPE